MGGQLFVRFFIDANTFEVYANPLGTTITVLPKQGDYITLLYNPLGLVNDHFIERQLTMHQKYKWLMTPIVHTMEEEAEQEPYEQSSLPARILHSLAVPKVIADLKHLKHQRRAIGLCNLLNISTTGGMELYEKLRINTLIEQVKDVNLLHYRIVTARKKIYDREQKDYNAFYF